MQASDSHLDLSRAPYVLYGVKYIDLVSFDIVGMQSPDVTREVCSSTAQMCSAYIKKGAFLIILLLYCSLILYYV